MKGKLTSRINSNWSLEQPGYLPHVDIAPYFDTCVISKLLSLTSNAKLKV